MPHPTHPETASELSDGTKPAQSSRPVAGPWLSEGRVCDDSDEQGLAVIAIIPEVERNGFSTPTRGMVAWVNVGIGACETDDQAVATARLIAAAPDLLEALKYVMSAQGEQLHDAFDQAHRAIAKAEHPTHAR